jgi:hypothetical protein
VRFNIRKINTKQTIGIKEFLTKEKKPEKGKVIFPVFFIEDFKERVQNEVDNLRRAQV